MKRLLFGLALLAGCGVAAEAPERVGEATSALNWVPHRELPGGDTVVVEDDVAMVSSGGDVHVFRLVGSDWVEEQVLSLAGFTLADGLDVSGDTMVVEAGIEEPWVFERVGGVWVEQQQLTPLGSRGYAVAISGDTAMVGTPTEFYSGGARGAVYVFERSGGTWTQVQRIPAPDLSSLSRGLGFAIALEQDRALVGARFADFDRGAAFYYEKSGGTWTLQQVVRPNDQLDVNTLFGSSVGMHGDRAIIGGPGTPLTGETMGRAFVFERQGGQWVEVAELTHPDVLDSDTFGNAVAIRGDVALVGAEFHYGVGTLKTGAAFVFTRDADSWSFTHKWLGFDPPGDRIGRSLSTSGDYAFVAGDKSHMYAFAGGMCALADDCDTGACVDGVCCNALCTDPCDRCDVAGREGDCTAAAHGTIGEPSCGAYVCDGVSTLCPTACRYDGDCIDSHYCPSGPEPGSCEPRFDNGSECSDDRECQSGVCLDGMCCDTPCNDACGSCTLPGSAGTCSPVDAGTQGSCAPFVCDGRSLGCPDRCDDDAACPVGFICNVNTHQCTDGPVCKGEDIVETPTATTRCEPYRCVPDACLDSCTTSAACVAPNVCNVEGKCVHPQDKPVRVGGCAIAGAMQPWGTPPWWLALVVVSRRRRRDNA